MKMPVKITLMSLMLILMVGCGSEKRNTITMQIAGQSSEFRLSNTVCQAENFSGASYGNVPLRCAGQIKNSASLADTVTFEIYDAVFISQNLGQVIPFGPATVTPIIVINGVPQAYIQGGGAVFSQISDFIGGAVCFRFEVFLASNIYISGEFCDNIAIGGYGAL